MATKGPGKAHREGIGLIELGEIFPDETAAVEWFESHIGRMGGIARAVARLRPAKLMAICRIGVQRADGISR